MASNAARQGYQAAKPEWRQYADMYDDFTNSGMSDEAAAELVDLEVAYSVLEKRRRRTGDARPVTYEEAARLRDGN
jgi:hypothetical protein